MSEQKVSDGGSEDQSNVKFVLNAVGPLLQTFSAFRGRSRARNMNILSRGAWVVYFLWPSPDADTISSVSQSEIAWSLGERGETPGRN